MSKPVTAAEGRREMLDRWAEWHADRLAIAGFLEWAQARGLVLNAHDAYQRGVKDGTAAVANAFAVANKHIRRDETPEDDPCTETHWPMPPSTSDLLDQYHEIDQAQLERERRALLLANRELEDRR